jgi:phosphoglycolate phosphatase-like HAD superfamily hydrolase
MNVPLEETSPSSLQNTPPQAGRRFQALKLATPSSCASVAYRYALTPTTPDPARAGFRLVTEDTRVIFFDFDGTLTRTPGEAATQRCEKKAELKQRAEMLAPRLRGLHDAGILLGIISKSTEDTIREALQEADLARFFEGPVIGKAVGFEGKAGFIRDLYESGDLGPSPKEAVGGLQCVLLIDDDVRELARARERGIQTFAAPQQGGLQEEDFDEILACLGLLASPSGNAEEDFTSPLAADDSPKTALLQ